MAEYKMAGVQVPGSKYNHEAKIGMLVSGVWNERPVVALFAHDEDGQHFIVLNDEPGKFRLLDSGELNHVQPIKGELIIEPAEGEMPFALPKANGNEHGLVISDKGEVGLRLTLPMSANHADYFVITSDLKTGNPMIANVRFLLKGFKILLKVEEREEPLVLVSFPA